MMRSMFPWRTARARRPGKTSLKIVVDQRYSSKASDFNSILSLIKSQNVDAILIAGHETEILNFIRQAKTLNVNPKLYSFTVGVPSADFRAALGQDANYAFGMTSWVPSPAFKDEYFGNAEQFASEYQKRFGYEPDYHAASAVADVEAFVKAIECRQQSRPGEGSRRHRQGRLRKLVWAYSLQRHRPDQSPADRCADPKGQTGAGLRFQGLS